MSGFQVYNSAGALTIDSDNKSVAISQLMGMGTLTDIGYYQIINSLGGQYTMGLLTRNFFPASGLRWFQLQTDGALAFPGATMYTANTGRFMITSNTIGLSSGYLDVFNASGQLIWSAVSASSMPRIVGFFSVPSSHDLGTPLTLYSPIANPWICISQCPGNLSDDGNATGYSGILIRRDNASTYTLQYINKNQKSYSQAMGSNGFNISLAYFTGY